MGTAVVTGASSGLGRELAVLLAARGERVLAVARRAEALDELQATSPRIEPVVADLATAEGRDALVERVRDVDVLVNNAGFGFLGPFVTAPPAVTHEMTEVNVVALTDLTARWLPGMLERGAGRVVNVASTAAFQPGPLMAVYYATKAYVLSFTEALAEELRGTGVTATAFCPGAFSSGFQSVAGLEGSRLVRGRRLPTSADMASAALAAMDRGTVVAVPGALNKAGAVAPRFAPRPFVRRMVRWVQAAP
jgi:short-subunit dehydrogenase